MLYFWKNRLVPDIQSLGLIQVINPGYAPSDASKVYVRFPRGGAAVAARRQRRPKTAEIVTATPASTAAGRKTQRDYEAGRIARRRQGDSGRFATRFSLLSRRRFHGSEVPILCVGARKDGGIEVVSPVEKESTHSASALRMRRHRERRRRGVLCFRIELNENVINELIRRKRLSPDYRANPDAVGQALQRYLDYTMW
jgi:hypothetical protein